MKIKYNYKWKANEVERQIIDYMEYMSKVESIQDIIAYHKLLKNKINEYTQLLITSNNLKGDEKNVDGFD